MMLWIANTVDVSDIPNEVKILPLGNVHSQKGDFTVDDESFHLILEQFQGRNLDLVIDYEHQTLKDVQAPAGGWIKELFKTNDAIMAKVEWTPKAKEYLMNKEYKYLSPVVLCRKSDGKAVSLHSVALTNTPAIDGMFSIVNSMDNTVDESLLPEPEEQPKDDGNTILAVLTELLGLPDGSDIVAIKSAIKELQKSKYSMEKEVTSLKYEAFEKEVEDIVQYALKTGKISSCMVKNATIMAKNDLQIFKNYVETAQQVVPIGKIAFDDHDPFTNGTASRINNMLGLTEEEVKKYNK